MKSTPSIRSATRIRIENFQSHQHTELELVPGVNIITGLEDSGKTALLRAVNWLRTNRPSGIDNWKFNKDKNRTVVVELDFADAAEVRHQKGKDSSEYFAGHAGTGEIFTKVGKEVPARVAELLQLEEINIQEQFDQPYLIWLTSGELANVFNRLSGMQRFDEWQAAVSAGIRSANSSIKTSQQDLDTAQQQLAQYAQLPVVEKLIAEIDRLDQRMATVTARFNRIRQLDAAIKTAQQSIASVRANEADCVRALEVVKHVRDLDKKILSINITLAALENIQSRAALIEVTAAALDGAKAEYIKALTRAGICDRCYGKIDDAAIARISRSMLDD